MLFLDMSYVRNTAYIPHCLLRASPNSLGRYGAALAVGTLLVNHNGVTSPICVC